MGNIGVPLITLLFSGGAFLVDGNPIYLSLAISTQLILMTVQNIALNSWGFHKGFSANEGTVKDSIKRMLSIPIIYAVLLVVIVRFLPFDLKGNPGYVALEYIEGGMIPIALLALGMQVGKTGIHLKKVRTYETLVFKMILSFVLAIGINMIFKFTGVIAQVFMIASMTPTAVNVALVSIEAGSQEEYTSQVVVLSTVIALLVLPFVLYATQRLYPI
jgi:predicted permease